MICEGLRSVFVHIPKTGGISIARRLLEHMSLDWDDRSRCLMRPNQDPAKGPPRLAHLTAREYVRLGYVDEVDWQDWFTFAFVRNPFDKLVSEYEYKEYSQSFSFKSWLLTLFPKHRDDRHDLGVDLHRHVMPQHQFICDAHGKVLVDFVGKMERLDEDFATVCERLGLPVKPLERHNASKRKHYRDYYDDETQDWVRRRYAKDLELFGYYF